ncbi:KIAA0895L [Branchiostoma lanceolatum]|uniref:KIAA0895L protein n=2 Tax=Branchiostoma lanceolatum TaxID=7740 RepID=A0A8K0A9H8_BRALA|nr:KIAA0895L [Branchiostoma lanceolatum]
MAATDILEQKPTCEDRQSTTVQRCPAIVSPRTKNKGRRGKKSPGCRSSCSNTEGNVPNHMRLKARRFTEGSDILKLPLLSSTVSVPRRRVGLLDAVRPANVETEKSRFMRANYNYNPLFFYNYPAAQTVLERFSKPSDNYLDQAITIMENALKRFGTYENFEARTGGKRLTRGEIMTIVKRCFKREKLQNGEVIINLSDDLLSRASMTQSRGRPTLNINVNTSRQFWLEGVARHEIGTHYLRSYNNRLQPWTGGKGRRQYGLLSVNPTEEGLASLHSVLYRRHPFLWRAALLYYTAYRASQMSFSNLFKDLGRFVRDPYVRWDYVLRAKRGQVDTSLPGCFCKDQVYLEGALEILRHRKDINFHNLMRMGKVSWRDLGRLQEHMQTDGTRIPSFMDNLDQYRKLLDYIVMANGLSDDQASGV